ncbi:MAG: sugar phosphate isomerase/epimerase [Chitinophagaceae bacterium]|nr:sugar phosphate isomerase/epimerase [Chitinophagaceae bacterium]
MSYDRRKFLQTSGQFAAALALGPVACKLAPKEAKTGAGAGTETSVEKPLGDFGIQLYTLREDFPKDPKGVLKQLADMGYKQIESFEGGKGMFWGMTNTEFKTYLDSLGLTIVSSHCNIDTDFEKKAEQAAAIGMKYLISPWVGLIDNKTQKPRTLDDFKKIAADFNAKGEICKKNGIRFAYHNHDYSFKPLEGQLPQNVMMDNTDPSLVDYEMDIYWVVAGGQDPEEWMKKYKNRFRLCHVKDRSKTPGTDNGKNSIDLGTGSIDFKKILRTAKENGMEYYIVEQEFYPNGTPLQAVKVCADYMKGMKV